MIKNLEAELLILGDTNAHVPELNNTEHKINENGYQNIWINVI